MLQAIIEQYGVPAFGVSLILLLVWLAGGRRNLRIDEAQLREILQTEGLGSVADQVISSDRKTALALPGTDAPVVLIRSQGDYWTATPLPVSDTAVSVDPGRDTALVIRFKSPGQAKARIVLPDAETVRKWHARLSASERGNV